MSCEQQSLASARRILLSLLARASACSLALSGKRGRVMTGVFIDFEAVMNSSRSLGIPKVTFASPLPVLAAKLWTHSLVQQRQYVLGLLTGTKYEAVPKIAQIAQR